MPHTHRLTGSRSNKGRWVNTHARNRAEYSSTLGVIGVGDIFQSRNVLKGEECGTRTKFPLRYYDYACQKNPADGNGIVGIL